MFLIVVLHIQILFCDVQKIKGIEVFRQLKNDLFVFCLK